MRLIFFSVQTQGLCCYFYFFFFIVDSFAYKFDSWRNRISKQAFLNNGKRLSHFWVDRPRRICNVVCVRPRRVAAARDLFRDKGQVG